MNYSSVIFEMNNYIVVIDSNYIASPSFFPHHHENHRQFVISMHSIKTCAYVTS